jgi:hypothetical protein
MKITVGRFLTLAAGVAALIAIGASVASAQTKDVYKLNYFSNNAVPADDIVAAPDATVRIDNPGLTYGNLCAMIFVFDADQQLSECCGCMQSHNNLQTYDVRTQLTYNPLTGVVSTNGVIKIVSATPNQGVYCNPTINFTPTSNLRAWGTHIQNPVAGAYPITETEFTDSPLCAAELSALEAQCAFISVLGSGHGFCSCGGG